MTEKAYKKLFAWQRADELAFQIYIATRSFPKEELFGICSQLRRAAVSVPANIVESNGRQNRKERKHFFNIALGSLAETEYFLDLCSRLGYINPAQYETLEALRNETGRLLWRLYQSL